MPDIQAKADKIIIALDVPTRKDALALVAGLPEAKLFKVGLQLFTAEGPGLIEALQEQGKDVFLDLKMHDIPNTVAGAVRMAVRRGVSFLTLHASGGGDMLAAAVEAAREESRLSGKKTPRLLAVTVLTSLKDSHLREIGFSSGAADQVRRLARLAREAGVDGVVCSPLEITLVRSDAPTGFLVVTPGIRPSWAAAQDQKRILGPAEALSRGADYLVVGRPVIAADSPAQAFRRICDELP
jgi:orotidine-5'-phosphate decarboxylase